MLRRSATAFAAALTLLSAVPGFAAAQSPTPTAIPAGAPACTPGPLALVLSGGGAKGLAHIGVLRELDRRGIRPDLVVGTSMGAIVGAMYASGYSGAEIDSLARALPIATFFRSYEPHAPQSLGALRPLVTWAQGERGFALQSAAVREPEVNALVNAAMLRGNLLAQGDFDRLPIPFRAVATDLADRAPVVLAGGDLARAVRASFAIPLIFTPERIGGRTLVDGGLAANIPIGVARAAGATHVIVSDATEHGRRSPEEPDTLNPDDPIRVADRLLDFLFTQPRDSLGAQDVRIRPAVDAFRSLDFSDGNVSRLIALGVAAADSTLARADCLGGTDGDGGRGSGEPGTTPARPLAAVQALARLHPMVDTVVFGDVPAGERPALARSLGLVAGEAVDPVQLRQRLRRIGDAETYRAVWLRPTRTPRGVRFDVAVEHAPRRVAGLGLAYDNELGGRMWVGLVDRRFLGTNAEASGLLALGELRRSLELGLRYGRGVGPRFVRPTLTGRIGTESVRSFDPAGVELPALKTREAVGFAGLERAFGGGWLASGGAEGRLWRNPDLTSASAWGGTARLVRFDRANRQTVAGDVAWTNVYHRASVQVDLPLHAGPVAVAPRLRLGWGERLPVQLAFPLGGYEGFPGLHLGELRGAREALAGVAATLPLRGPLDLRLEVATGRSALAGPLLDRHGWLAGARAGLGAETPIGPVRVEYGRVLAGAGFKGRDAVVVRIGRWF
ncbi:MAG TPA: patatin-like phospholipase family protein [Gemmatimonadales bacterium]|nr:patatin-like phospholipase family protein [Gemmatimonadales bacterium]